MRRYAHDDFLGNLKMSDKTYRILSFGEHVREHDEIFVPYDNEWVPVTEWHIGDTARWGKYRRKISPLSDNGKIDSKEKFAAVIDKCYEGTIENVTYGERLVYREGKASSYKKHDPPKTEYYYELQMVCGAFGEISRVYKKSHFRPLSEQEMVNEIFAFFATYSGPYYFDFDKKKYCKKIEAMG